ncbi:MAG: hypothetical protein II877_00820 [Synergistaceae bacterium]|nr:hypothetical protein [Synergistaceae bacterium]MBQ7168427.1 hypothetical protein [Synergistaceae bacterium]
MDDEIRIYTGPGVPALGLEHNAVYVGEYPGYIAAMLEKYDKLEGLFASLSDYAGGLYLSPDDAEYHMLVELLTKIARKEA